MNNNYMCFTNFPKTSELLCLFATIIITEKINTSLYNLVIKKCRQLIFENNDVIAVPCLENIYGIYIIVKEKFYETGQLQKYLNNHNLKAGAPTAVSKNIYEDCCMYTITAKLAPKWNIISNYFVRGRNFLINFNPTDCVRLSLRINDKGETSLIFEISRIKIPTMSLDKLDLSNDDMKELYVKNIITYKFHNSKTIRVLPSLKRGNILSINLKINETFSFGEYKQFRRHWKNTYGYRLPETDEDIFYLEISFFDGSSIFTYPSLCVRPYEPTFVQRVEPKPVVARFLADLLKSMPTILGDKYPIPDQINQPGRYFFSGKENLQYKNIGAINTNNIPDTQNSAIVYLPSQKTETVENDEDSNTKSKLSQLVSQMNKPENNSPVYLTQSPSTTLQISQTPLSVLQNSTNTSIPTFKNNLSIVNKSTIKPSLISKEIKQQFDFLSEKAAERSSMTTKQNPNLIEPKNNTNETKQNSVPNEKYVPKFTSKFPKIKKIKTIPTNLQTNITQSKKEIEETNSDKTKEIQKLGNMPKIKKFKNVSTNLSKENICDKITEIKKIDNKVNKKITKNISTKETDIRKAKKEIKLLETKSANTKNIRDVDNKPKDTLPDDNKEADSEEELRNDFIEQNNNTPRKRIFFDVNKETIAKKPRNKPVAMEVSNMEVLVNNGEIQKLNIQSLMKWLKERNIQCTTKDKKLVLIEKVIKNLKK